MQTANVGEGVDSITTEYALGIFALQNLFCCGIGFTDQLSKRVCTRNQNSLVRETQKY